MNLPRKFLILLLRAYQLTLSPMLSAMFGSAGQCRYTPSCSQYAIEALQIHGVFRGGALAGWRLCRCNPWGDCGHDPVPEKGAKLSASADAHALGAASRGRS